jgi:hypothetical protein
MMSGILIMITVIDVRDSLENHFDFYTSVGYFGGSFGTQLGPFHVAH